MLEEVHKLFKMAQLVGLEELEWISEAQKHCELIGGCHSWHWSDPEAGAVVVHTHLPLLEGQGQIECGLVSVPGDNSPTDCEPPTDTSKAIIIHPHHSTWIIDHPEYNPFTLLNSILGPPVYHEVTPLLEDLLMTLSIFLKE